MTWTAASKVHAPAGWFEDFSPGLRMRHSRASTIGEFEGAVVSKQVMNTAQGHFNEHFLRESALGQGRIVFGLATASTVIGLTSEDTSEHAVAELGCDRMRFRGPVHHGDTLEAFTEVIETSGAPDQPDAGIVRFKHWGRKQDGTVVFECERTVLVRRRDTEAHA